jgi:hypothetical protein
VPIVENFDIYKIAVSDSMRHILESYLNYTVKVHLALSFLLEVLREFLCPWKGSSDILQWQLDSEKLNLKVFNVPDI